MKLTTLLLVVGCIGVPAGLAQLPEPATYNVRDFGARPDGQTLCTRDLQAAIDRCATDGGGVVYFPPGTFLTGTLYMKSGVTLRLSDGCTLLGSTSLEDYPATVPQYRSYTDNYTDKSLIYGEKLRHIAITGRGVINGQGAAFQGPYKVRPYLIRFVDCGDVVVEDVTIRDSPMWVQHYLACEDVRIDGVTVTSHVNQNNDGIDIDSCRRVIVTACNVDSGDDAIVLKSTSARPCEDIVISGCVLRSTCNALKMGTESNGGFRNVVVSTCTIWDTRLAGVALEIVDGGTMDRIVISDITMNRVGAPLFIRLGNRARPFTEDMNTPGLGTLRNVTISNIEASGANATGCAISGIPQAAIENVTLSNLRLSFAGGGTRQQASRVVPEDPQKYPEYSMFGPLPAYGLYCRHVRGLRLAGVQLQVASGDKRHALALEDVEDVAIDGLDAAFSEDGEPLIRMTDVRQSLVRNCIPRAGDVFLGLEGARTEGITLLGNDLRRVKTPVDSAADVPKAALVMLANRID